MEPLNPVCLCDGSHTLHRRGFLKLAGGAGIGWLTPVADILAREADPRRARDLPQSVIVLWMAGGPSQLETFDPNPNPSLHPKDGPVTKAINTAVKGVQLAEGLERLGEQMECVSLVRSLVSKEGDHERGTYTIKTGYRPDPSVGVGHPSLGAVVCHELKDETKIDIPAHVSILPNQWPARGAFLGDEYDAFKLYDPSQKLPDVTARVSSERDRQRVADLDVVERTFARGRLGRVEATGHRETIQRARLMMGSEQLKAFDVSAEPESVRKLYGDTPFGRGCLAARRLIQVGVRCVEVTLDGWDTHVSNHTLTKGLVATLDPAFSGLLADLKQQKLLDRTIVLCLGEFGRTPKVNPASGRDHWPDGFSVAIAGGRIRGGHVVGATDPNGRKLDPKTDKNTATIGDLHATVLAALGIDHHRANTSTTGRPIRLADGEPIRELVAV